MHGRPSRCCPFENRSREADDAFFVDGIHDDILTQLSKVSALRVISRTSVEQFRDTKLPMKAIADQLGVTKILEGGVQRAGDRVRINVQLIDASSDAHLWAESYDRELTAANIFAIQSELAERNRWRFKGCAVAGRANARVAAVPTQNLEAWEAYQLGQQRFAKSTSDSLDDAERFFQKAIALDPQFALAYVGLADTILLQINYSNRPRQDGLEAAEQAARKALKLEPDLAEAWASLGAMAIEPEEAVRRLRRAIDLSPNLAAAHLRLSNALEDLGERDESLQHAERALQLDPLSTEINIDVGYTLDEMGRFEEAAARYRRAIEIDPQSSIAYMHLAFLHAYAWNRFAEAVPLIERAIELDTGNSSIAGVLAFVLLDMDEETRSAKAMADAMRNAPGRPIAECLRGLVLQHARGPRRSRIECSKGGGGISARLLVLVCPTKRGSP